VVRICHEFVTIRSLGAETLRERPDPTILGGAAVSASDYLRVRERCPDMNLDDIPLTTLTGEATTLAAYPGARLIVNVASRCGHTPQYAALEELHRRYRNRGFTVIGFPSNQFLQELSSAGAIAEFCSTTYGVTFPLMAKTRVNGRSAHPLFRELTTVPDADGVAGKVAWNFEKFLVTDRVHRFRTKVQPDDPVIVDLIEAHLRKAEQFADT
jgi:glutathione peroxidase